MVILRSVLRRAGRLPTLLVPSLTIASFRWPILAQVGSSAGNAMASLGDSLLLVRMTADPAMLAIGWFVFALPTLALGSWAGVWLQDRPLHAIAAWGTSLQALNEACLVWTIVGDDVRWWSLLLSFAVRGAISAFATPASSAMLYATVPEEHRDNAVAVRTLAGPIALLIGVVFGAVALDSSSSLRIAVATCVIANLASFVLFPAAVAGLGPEMPSRTWRYKPSPVPSVRRAWSVTRERHELWMPLTGVAVMSMLAFQLGSVFVGLTSQTALYTSMSVANAGGVACGATAAVLLSRSRPAHRSARPQRARVVTLIRLDALTELTLADAAVPAALCVAGGELAAAQTQAFAARLAAFVIVGIGTGLFLACTVALLLRVSGIEQTIVVGLTGVAQLGAGALGALPIGLLARHSPVAALRVGALAALAAAIVLFLARGHAARGAGAHPPVG